MEFLYFNFVVAMEIKFKKYPHDLEHLLLVLFQLPIHVEHESRAHSAHQQNPQKSYDQNVRLQLEGVFLRGYHFISCHGNQK